MGDVARSGAGRRRCCRGAGRPRPPWRCPAPMSRSRICSTVARLERGARRPGDREVGVGGDVDQPVLAQQSRQCPAEGQVGSARRPSTCGSRGAAGSPDAQRGRARRGRSAAAGRGRPPRAGASRRAAARRPWTPVPRHGAGRASGPDGRARDRGRWPAARRRRRRAGRAPGRLQRRRAASHEVSMSVATTRPVGTDLVGQPPRDGHAAGADLPAPPPGADADVAEMTERRGIE